MPPSMLFLFSSKKTIQFNALSTTISDLLLLFYLTCPLFTHPPPFHFNLSSSSSLSLFSLDLYSSIRVNGTERRTNEVEDIVLGLSLIWKRQLLPYLFGRRKFPLCPSSSSLEFVILVHVLQKNKSKKLQRCDYPSTLKSFNKSLNFQSCVWCFI